jgi:hypothetical protein
MLIILCRAGASGGKTSTANASAITATTLTKFLKMPIQALKKPEYTKVFDLELYFNLNKIHGNTNYDTRNTFLKV